MSTSITMKQQRADIIRTARNILDKGDLDHEQEQQYDQLMKQADDLATEIKKVERNEHQAKLETELSETVTRQHKSQTFLTPRNERDEARAFTAWVRNNSRKCSVRDTDLSLAESYGFNPYANDLNIPLDYSNKRALDVGTGSQGGYFVPTLLSKEVTTFLKYFCPLRNWVRTLPTETGANFDWPTWDATGLTSAITSEGTQYAEKDATVGKVRYSAYKYPGTVTISVELLTDAIVDLVPLISEGLAQTIGRGQEVDFETGNGEVRRLVSPLPQPTLAAVLQTSARCLGTM